MKNRLSLYHPFDLVDPFFDDFFEGERKSMLNQVMKTDIKDQGTHYEFKIELPEIKKEDIHLSLENGYLTVEASLSRKQDEKETGHYVRKERYFGNFSRSYYVGTSIRNEDIKAKLDAGVLTLWVKKEEQTPEKKYISIE